MSNTGIARGSTGIISKLRSDGNTIAVLPHVCLTQAVASLGKGVQRVVREEAGRDQSRNRFLFLWFSMISLKMRLKMGKKTALLAGFAFMGLLAAFYLSASVHAAAKGDAKAAMDVYKKNCERCHGEKGKGDGAAGKFLKVKPADWTDKARMSKLTEKELTEVINKGGGAVGKSPVMPGFADKLKPQDVENLIALIREMSGT
jgi:mono/diheme cytochrome c family protein